jgi:hypothetical protein
MSRNTVARPWYREPWPWLLMVPPFGAVVGGFAMLALAIGAPEALVVDDYSRIEELTRAQFAADRHAADLELRATIGLAHEDGGQARVTVELRADSAFVAPRELNLRLRHAARAEADRKLQLVRDGSAYAGEVTLDEGRYTIEISPADASWRLAGYVASVPAVLELTPPTSATAE